MGGSNDEMLAVLREIRDLQRQHFDRYVEFTHRVIEQQKRAAARAEADTEAALAEQRRIAQIVRRQQVLVPVLAVALALCMALVGWLALAR